MVRLLSTTTVLAAAWAVSVEHVPPELNAPPPPSVRDIKGTSFDLPSATSANASVECVEAFAKAPFAGKSGNRQNPFSSHGEDRAALGHFGGAPTAWGGGSRRRVFLEMGGFDGVSESNTIMLERCLGWRGVLVEANPTAWRALKTSGRNHAERVFAAPTCPTLATARMASHSFTNAAIVQDGENARHVATVPCTSLTRILQRALGPRPRVDFFSLDVEGSEDKVLATLNFKAVDVALVFAESVNAQCKAVCPRREAVRARMKQAGYAFNPFRVPKSDVFLRQDLMTPKAARRLLRDVRRARGRA